MFGRRDSAKLTVRILSAGFLVLFLAGCAHPAALTPRPAANPEVRMLNVGRGAHAYLVMGARPILVDTGWGNSPKKIEREITKNGVDPKTLALIVLTHGHGDHSGGAKRLHALSGAPVVAGAGDVAMCEAGHEHLKRTGFLGLLLHPFSERPFPPFTPDIALTGNLDLKPYGVEGTVIPVPGHTPGSLAVLLPTGDAMVGDMFRGRILCPHLPTRHFYHDDPGAAEAHVVPLVAAGAKEFYLGHGGPVDAARAAKKFPAAH